MAITAAPSGAAFLFPEFGKARQHYALRVYFSEKWVYVFFGMNWAQLTNGVKQIWENKPGVILLLIMGFLVFVFIVVDTRRHRRRQKEKHPRKY